MSAEGPARDLRYRAFISYSRSDRDAAVRLQRLLESYVLPTALRLAGPGVRHDARPMRPVFRDEDELVPGQDLPARIREGLSAAASLLVICSPRAAMSHWVDKEIREFRALGGHEILAVLVNGVPNAAEGGRDPALECLPPALRVDAGGEAAPMVDWRSEARERDGLLELIALMLSLGSLDALIREDDRAAGRRVLGVIGAVAAAAVLAVGGLVTFLASDVLARTSRSDQFAVLAAEADARGDEPAAMRFALASVQIIGPWLPLTGVPGVEGQLQSALLRPSRILTVPGYGGGVTGMTVSADGRTIVVAARDGTLRILDGATGAQRLPPIAAPADDTTPFYQTAITAPALSPDATRVAAIAPDQTLRLWDAATGRSLGATPPYLGEGQITTLAWAPDGARLATGSFDSVQFWDGRRLTAMGTLPAIPDVYATALTFSPDGRRVVGGMYAIGVTGAAFSRVGELAVWDARPGAGAPQTLIGGGSEPTSIAWSPDGRRIAAAHEDGVLRIWDAASGRLIATSPQAAIAVVAWSPDSKLVATGSGAQGAKDYDVRLWDGETGQEIGPPLLGHAGRVSGVAFTPDGAQIVSGGQDATIRFWPVARLRAMTPKSLVGLACQALAGAAPAPRSAYADEREAAQLVSVACGRR